MAERLQQSHGMGLKNVGGMRMETQNGPGSCPPRSVRLLLVDDEPDILEIVAQYMETAGYSVLTAQSGVAALALLDRDPNVDLIVSDLSMPGMDGVQLIQRAQRRRPQLPAIILTGLAENGAEASLGQVIRGPFAILPKPINANQLADRVAKLLDDAQRAELKPLA
jgi:CheY-like chemotaxis protein